jgi:uncharacterized protein (DUF2267 family)
MSNTGIAALDKSLDTTTHWLHDIQQELHLENPEQAWTAWKGVAHALRDTPTVDEAADLAAQLPTPLRGLFYEQYKPDSMPERASNAQAFYDRVARKIGDQAPTQLGDPIRISQGVVMVMKKYVTGGEMADALGMLPQDLQSRF